MLSGTLVRPATELIRSRAKRILASLAGRKSLSGKGQPDDRRLFSASDGLNDVVEIVSITCELSLADVYNKAEMSGDEHEEDPDRKPRDDRLS